MACVDTDYRIFLQEVTASGSAEWYRGRMKRRVTLTLDDETAAVIKSLAARFGVSKSQLLSEAIRDFGPRPGADRARTRDAESNHAIR